ncbi:hypothetical protein HMPREF1557_00422 [Streptococcus sobrinus W1703]|uniref:Uncharacterized protein n=1 Tax=Streptococcus sobrinus W1703 TaxID=1227275 RepID=U2IVT4_9STRE|nr:hypothetical protein HMPREF1557_00422 [Streptococcus sobrinus W1703]
MSNYLSSNLIEILSNQAKQQLNQTFLVRFSCSFCALFWGFL